MQKVAVSPRALGAYHSEAPIEKVESWKGLFDQLLKKTRTHFFWLSFV